MSHLLDIDGVLEKLVLLEHFSAGSRDYCKMRLAGSRHDQGYAAYDDYWGWVKGITSNYLLECAIKYRVIQDTIHGKEDILDLASLKREAQGTTALGTVAEGKFPLTLREANNKIIHAVRVVPLWKEGRAANERFKFWSGNVELSGKKGKTAWRLHLCVAAWSQVMQRYLEFLSRSDAGNNIGQDWYGT